MLRTASCCTYRHGFTINWRISKIYHVLSIDGSESKNIYNQRDKPFDLKLLKTDIPMFLDADDELQKCEMKITYAEECINYIESILKMVSNRTYQIKNALEHRRFEAGG